MPMQCRYRRMQVGNRLAVIHEPDIREPQGKHTSHHIHPVHELFHPVQIDPDIRFPFRLLILNEEIRQLRFEHLRRLHEDREIELRLIVVLAAIVFGPFILHHLHQQIFRLGFLILTGSMTLRLEVKHHAGRQHLDDVVHGSIILHQFQFRRAFHIRPPEFQYRHERMILAMHNAVLIDKGPGQHKSQPWLFTEHADFIAEPHLRTFLMPFEPP